MTVENQLFIGPHFRMHPKAKALIRLARPGQWVKNTFVLAPLLFSGKYVEPASIIAAVKAMLLFCVASAAVYVLNDIRDVEKDRLHPRKSCTRPIAARQITIPEAVVFLCLLYAIMALSAFLMPTVFPVLLAYLFLNVAYTLRLKQIPVLDIFTVAIGFVLRVYAGSVALPNVKLSSWMLITTLALALYMASIKRRQELRNVGDDTRKVLKQYSVELVDRYAQMSATGALVFYSMFVVTTRPELVFTIPFVLFGIFRYWYVVEKMKWGESPAEVLFADWQLLASVILWAAICCWNLSPHALA